MLQCYKKLTNFYLKKKAKIISEGGDEVIIYLLPPTITGGLPPSDPGNPGTT